MDVPEGWKTYTNEEFGFAFDYPGEWEVKEIKGPPDILSLDIFLMAKDIQQADAMLHVNPLNVGRASVFDRGANPACELKSIAFAGREAKECISDLKLEYIRNIRILNLTNTHWQISNEISLSIKDRYRYLIPEYNKILDTFMFIE